MRNFKKFTAFVLALCMVFSLSVAAFAAEADEHTVYESAPEEEITVQSAEAATSGTIPGSSIKWSLDSKGWLTISGSGEAPVFQSADDQPWATVREEITEVWFEDMETLSISDLAYWFEGCTNLTTAELPLAPVIGKHAFYGCSKLSTLTMYYGETVLKSIGEDAFWRETDSGDTLYIAYLFMIFMVYIRMRMLAPLRSAASRKRREPQCSPLVRSSATARPAANTRFRAPTWKSRILRAATQITTNVIPATTFSILEHTPTRATALALTVPAPARTAAATHGCWTTKAPPPAPAMGTAVTAVSVVKRSLKPSTQAVTAIPMGAGHSIHRHSTGANRTAGIAAIRIMNTPATV